MAQTNYNSRSAYLYANALLNQGANPNPIVDWFTNPQGGGLANWLTDQGNQINKRINNDLAYKIEHDENLIDKVREAQNQGRDLRKELLQGYFIDPYDETLNTAVDNLNTKAINRLNTDISTAVTSKLNQDNYKGGSIIDEAKNLGWNNLTKEQEAQLKEYEQKALKARYEEPLRREIANRLIENPNYDPTQLVQQYNAQYGMNLNPNDYMDITDEKTNKYKKAVSADLSRSILRDMDTANGRYEQSIKHADMLMASDPDNWDKYKRIKDELVSRQTKAWNDSFDDFYMANIKAGTPALEIIQGMSKWRREKHIPPEQLISYVTNNKNLMNAVGDSPALAKTKMAMEQAKAAKQDYIAGLNSDINRAKEEYNLYSPSTTISLSKPVSNYINEHGKEALNLLHLPDEKALGKFLSWLDTNNTFKDSSDINTYINEHMGLVTDKVNTYMNNREKATRIEEAEATASSAFERQKLANIYMAFENIGAE